MFATEVTHARIDRKKKNSFVIELVKVLCEDYLCLSGR